MSQSRSPEDINLACFELSRELDSLAFSVPAARPLARTLLRVVGRVVIDAGGSAAAAGDWPGTEEMVIAWIDEALAPLGRRVEPRA